MILEFYDHLISEILKREGTFMERTQDSGNNEMLESSNSQSFLNNGISGIGSDEEFRTPIYSSLQSPFSTPRNIDCLSWKGP